MTTSWTPETTRRDSCLAGTRAAGQTFEAGQQEAARQEAARQLGAPRQIDARQPVDGARLARELAGLAAAVNREHADEGTSLGLITEAATNLIPGADCAAIVVPVRGGELHVRAAQGDLPLAVADIQLEIGQGPCLDAAAWNGPIILRDAAADARWAPFGKRAAAVGASGIVCAPLATERSRSGILILIAKNAGAFGEQAAELATAFAEHASLALAGAESRRQFSVALSSRDVIGQAKGILMERYRVTAEAAFALLACASQETNTKLRDVAGELCQTGGLPPSARDRS